MKQVFKVTLPKNGAVVSWYKIGKPKLSILGCLRVCRNIRLASLGQILIPLFQSSGIAKFLQYLLVSTTHSYVTILTEWTVWRFATVKEIAGPENNGLFKSRIDAVSYQFSNGQCSVSVLFSETIFVWLPNGNLQRPVTNAHNQVSLSPCVPRGTKCAHYVNTAFGLSQGV